MLNKRLFTLVLVEIILILILISNINHTSTYEYETITEDSYKISFDVDECFLTIEKEVICELYFCEEIHFSKDSITYTFLNGTITYDKKINEYYYEEN